LKAIIDAIIDLSAIDAGAMELKLATLDVASVLQTVAEKLSPTMIRRDQTLSIELAEDSLAFVGDTARVEQIISNLLSNAIGFSTRGSQIRMGARRSGANVQIWIADSGRGIDPEFQKKAFERFQSKPLPGSHRGPGLGLAIVKSFTELHGGNVSLISKLDRGTTVVCSFPVDGPARPNPSNTPVERLSPQRVA
jgi:signal transduction histidine kinase